MKYLNNNFEIIKVKNPKVYKILSDYLSKNGKNENIFNKFKVVDTKDGEKTVEVNDNGRFIRFNSIYSPKREAKRWGDRFENIENATSLVMFGLGNGIFYKVIKERVNKSAYIFLYEPNIELFLFYLENFDMSDILSDSRVLLYVAGVNDKDFFVDLSTKINWAMLSSQIVCVHPIYDKVYDEEYIKFSYMIEQFNNSLNVQKNTSMVYAKTFTINAVRNLHFIENSNYISEFIGKIDEDIPMIIVSAGPSLDKNIDKLKKAEKKAFILATDTSVKYLLAHNIKFDAIVTVDGRKSVRHLKDERCNKYPIFTVPDARNEVLESNIGRKIWINGSGYLGILYEKYGCYFPNYLSGGSVATAAFWIALTLRLKTIILVGQDLAFDGEKTHAGGITGQYIGWEEKQELYVDGVNGDEVKTRADWLGYLRWFENAINQIDESFDIIDATEGGAKIKGTIIMPLSEAIMKYCKKDFDFNHILEQITTTFNYKDYKNICNDIFHIKKEFEIIIKASKEGESASERIISMIERNQLIINKIDINMQKIRKSQEIIQKQNIYALLDEYISADIAERLDVAAKKYDSETEELLEKAKSLKILFKSLINAVNELTPVLQGTLKEI